MKKPLQGNSATASQNLAACRNAARNLLRLNGADVAAATLRHYACRP